MDIPDSWIAANEAIGDLHDAPQALRNLADAVGDVSFPADGDDDAIGRDDLRRWAAAIETLLT